MRSLTKAEIINTNGGRDDKGGNFHTNTTTKKEKETTIQSIQWSSNHC